MTEPALLANVIAHRGASGTAPENTVSAFELAAAQKAGCVELDAMISRDGIAFVHHDDTLDRCTDGQGYLCAQDSTELDTLKAACGKTAYRNEPLPRLTTVVDRLKELDLGLNLEIKPTPGLEEPTALAVCDVIRERWPADLPLVLSSFSRESLAVARDALPGAARALIVCAVPEDWNQQLQQLQCRNLHVAQELLQPGQVTDIRDAGYGLYCFTVNDVTRAKQLFAMGVHGVFTDYPAELIGAL